MSALYAKYPEHPGVAAFDEARSHLNAFLASPVAPPIEVNGAPLLNGQILRGVIYGELAHLDDEKRAAMKQLRDAHPWMSAMVDFAFTGVVGQFLRVLFYMQRVNRDIVRDLANKDLSISHLG